MDNNNKKGYRYVTLHGLGPGTLPKDAKLLDWEDLPNYKTAIYLDRPLTTEELKFYDIKPEWIQESKVSVFESLTDEDVEALSELKLDEAEMDNLLSLLELISDENKVKAFEFVNAIFKGKELIPISEKEVSEQISKSARYTQILLGKK